MTGLSSTARIAIIGTGHVGATTAYALMLRGLISEIVLIDSDMARAAAEAADIADANALARPAHIWAGSYADAALASIAIVTAGAATHDSESRLSVLASSATIVTTCVERLMGAGFAGIILVAANPVDLMAHVAFRVAGLPAARVIGTGTLLDSNRLRQLLAAKLDVAPASVAALVLGEHGDSEVAAFSTIRVGGETLHHFSHPGKQPDVSGVAYAGGDAGYRIVTGKGYSSFGVATAIVRICEAIIRNERAVLPVSTFLSGQLGISDVYLSLPCILGTGGIERILVPDLTANEKSALRRSGDVVRNAMSSIDGND
jgi:L-lactate dehydrogenase